MPYFGASPSSELANLDINGQKLILDADADTSITADTDDQIDIEVSGSDELKITTAMFGPASADGSALGGTSNEWSDLYLADSGVIYFGNDQDVTVTHDPDDGLFLKSTATSSSNPFVLTLQTGETDIVTNDVLGTINFQAPDEHNGTDAILVGASIRAIAEENFAADNNATAIQFLTGRSETAATIARVGSRGTIEAQSGSVSYCSFTDIDDGHTGMYFPAGDTLGFVTGGTEFVRIDASGELFVGDTTNANCTQGITVNQGANDNEILSLKSSDVSHSNTGDTEADTYTYYKKYSGTAGGLKESNQTEGIVALWHDVVHDTQQSAAASDTAVCPYNVRAIVTADSYAHDANVALFAWRKTISGGSSRNIVLFDEDGDIHLDGSTSAFDKDDDALLCRSFDLALADPKTIIKSEFDNWTANHKEKLIEAGILGHIDPDNPAHYSYPEQAVAGSPASDPSNPPVLAKPMINSTQLQRLHNGAIWQQRLMFETLKEVAEELLPGFASKLNERLESKHLPALPA